MTRIVYSLFETGGPIRSRDYDHVQWHIAKVALKQSQSFYDNIHFVGTPETLEFLLEKTGFDPFTSKDLNTDKETIDWLLHTGFGWA